MINIGITGQSGFIGQNLVNYLQSFENISLIFFNRTFFSDSKLLDNWVKKCDIIFHLAAISRHDKEKTLYDINIMLVKKLISSLERTNSKPQIIYTSSTHEIKDTYYSKSKYEGRMLFSDWSVKNNTIFNGLILPNVFGPYAKPNYASVVATFCYNVSKNIKSKIISDAKMKLIYIDELLHSFLEIINQKKKNNCHNIAFTHEIYVSEILKKLNNFYDSYKSNKTPILETNFDKNLHFTFMAPEKEKFSRACNN